MTTPNHTNEQKLRDELNTAGWQGPAVLQALATSRLADAQERTAAALELANKIALSKCVDADAPGLPRA